MLSGQMTGLRAITDADIEVFEAELMNDAETRMRSDARPYRPVAPGSAQSPYRNRDDRSDADPFADGRRNMGHSMTLSSARVAAPLHRQCRPAERCLRKADDAERKEGGGGDVRITISKIDCYSIR